ncbi:mitochondrial distribution and morphology protein 36 [Monosporozyma unispora]|nr:hypothetical protein C6P44_000388 [Kazachstania unispora]
MSNTSSSGDGITSLFQDENINVNDLQDVIENQITKPGENWKSYKMSLSYCYESLNIISDLLKLQMFYNDSIEFQSLNGYIEEKFIRNVELNGNMINHISHVTKLIELRDDVSYDQWKYKENALKTIQKCNKMLIGLDSLTINLTDIREFIDNNMDELLRDSMTLLAEIWFYLVVQFKWFKIQIVSTFIKSKCLLINFELHLVLDYLMNSDYYEGNAIFKREVSEKLQNTILSFNSYISDLIKNINHAIEIKDENLYNESFTSFLDIEVMYNHLNFEWLIPEEENEDANKSLSDETTTKHYLNSDPKDIQNLEHISQYVDNMIELIPESETETPVHSPRRREQLYPTNNRNNTPMLQGLTAPMSITRELPHLLNAFNNVKRLENDIEASSKLIQRPEKDELIYRNVSPSNVRTPTLKKRSQSMSSSVSTSSTLYSNPGFPSSSSTTATTSIIVPTAKMNDDNDINFKNMYSSMTPTRETANKKLGAAYRIPNGPTTTTTTTTTTTPSQMSMSQPGLTLTNPLSVCVTNPLSMSTSMATQSQVLMNDLKKLMLMQEQLSVMNNKTIPTKKSFSNSPLNSAPHGIGFHSVLLNNLYGISGVRTQTDINRNLRSAR